MEPVSLPLISISTFFLLMILMFGTIILYLLASMIDIMRTFVMITFSSEGGSASQVVNKLIDMGFEATFGNHDFVYNWDKNASQDSVISLIDQVQKKLKGMNVQLQFATQ